MVRHNDMMEGIIMGPHFMFLIAENIMTYSGEPQSQSAALVNKPDHFNLPGPQKRVERST